MSVTPAIPASQIVSVTPSVLSAGGTALDLNGLVLTPNTRAPIGQLLSFPSPTAVANYFGSEAPETAHANIYFLGFNTSNVKPGALLYWQYPWAVPVAAYLWGGSVSALGLAGLQALSGTLTITINGTPVTSGTINLSSATSFSNAAQLIQAGFAISGPVAAMGMGAISGTTLTLSSVSGGIQQGTITGSISGTTLTVTAVGTGVSLAIGQYLGGSGVTAGTTITALGSGAGGVGTYTISTTQTVASETIDVYAPPAIAVGDYVNGTGVTSGTYITALGTGTGGAGTYTVSASQTVTSESLTINAPAVVYDSLSGGFFIYSGTTGSASTISYASGSLATPLALTQAAGAVLSQGSNIATPAAALNQVIAVSQDWASFMTTFEPVAADKEGFAAWENAQNNRFLYAMWDTNIVNTESSGPSPAVAAIAAAAYSGTAMLYSNPEIDTIGGEIAAFLLGYGASLDFTETQGRATAAFKAQSGLAAQVTNGTVADYLEGYGLNFYGDFTTANQEFTFLYPGSIVGPFAWIDSYLDQIWLNNQFQLALLVFLTTIKSAPYNTPGYGLIQAACRDVIDEAGNFGIFQPGVTLSAAQIAEVNSAAGGLNIATILQQQGWYLLIQPASPQVRAARGSPPMTFWYTDGGSVQKLNLASIEVQ